MPPAPLPAQASGSSAIGDLLAGGVPGQGASQMQSALEGLAGQIRDLKSQVDAIGTEWPTAAPFVARINEQLKGLMVAAAQAASTMTASGAAVPTGGSNGPAPM